jgi:hypothetical protein
MVHRNAKTDSVRTLVAGVKVRAWADLLSARLPLLESPATADGHVSYRLSTAFRGAIRQPKVRHKLPRRPGRDIVLGISEREQESSD